MPDTMPAEPLALPGSLRFTDADVDAAAEGWGCNCGPAALAAIAGVTLDDARALIAGFDEKRYTSPTMMFAAVARSGRAHHMIRPPRWPRHGLVRVQWEGPWTAPGVPIRARYRHTHWVGSMIFPGNVVQVFDVNAMHVGGWITLESWMQQLVPWLLRAAVPRASGGWHITHAVELANA